jgi:hypothetical protein
MVILKKGDYLVKLIVSFLIIVLSSNLTYSGINFSVPVIIKNDTIVYENGTKIQLKNGCWQLDSTCSLKYQNYYYITRSRILVVFKICKNNKSGLEFGWKNLNDDKIYMNYDIYWNISK